MTSAAGYSRVPTQRMKAEGGPQHRGQAWTYTVVRLGAEAETAATAQPCTPTQVTEEDDREESDEDVEVEEI
eukprot:CAMPEP_0115257062 /NCGR_PEP_ID=MMETSP0270-20121206/46572_1 /TAXON_ID=71861 /ORGANISM="Scrippsiella trochoidea, Strain CCMP3099" /LENGTH=71 /DNA_ID=CAMNT_0002672743 /DNA_START=82 /DNA_END=297 /DNA_ORIENTATION=-